MPEPDSLIKQELEKFIAELHKDYEVWYAKSVRKTFRWWWLLQVTSLLSGFAFALIAALVAADVFVAGTVYKTFSVIALVVLPALSALAANTVIQFRVYDMWRLRERGRISFQNLVIEGRRRIHTAKSEQEYADIFEDLQKKPMKLRIARAKIFSLSRNQTLFQISVGLKQIKRNLMAENEFYLIRRIEQINGRDGETATLLFGLSVKGWRAWRLRPTSSQSLAASP